jgi:hypothetical protein
MMHPRHRHLAFRGGVVLITVILLGLAVALPFALQSVAEDLAGVAEGAVFSVPITPGVRPAATHTRLHVSLVDLDEAQLAATLRVSGHHVCAAACPQGARVVLFSLGTDEAATAGMPPSTNVDLTTAERLATATITLPIRGHPSRYPFDTYELWLGLGLARLLPDGTEQPLSRTEGAGQLFLTLQEQLPRELMLAPTAADPDVSRDAADPYELQAVSVLRFERPLHQRILAVLLVILIAAAAAYAVLMRPLNDLVINSGALVLGVWGIRAILTPGTAYRTVIDLALSAVILFLLGAITVRALEYCYRQGDLPFSRRPAGDLHTPPSKKDE